MGKGTDRRGFLKKEKEGMERELRTEQSERSSAQCEEQEAQMGRDSLPCPLSLDSRPQPGDSRGKGR